MHIIKWTLPNDKQVLLLGKKVYDRWPEEEWNGIDPRIIQTTGIPRDAVVEYAEV